MKISKLFLVSIFLLAVLTMGAVSASEDADNIVNESIDESIEINYNADFENAKEIDDKYLSTVQSCDEDTDECLTNDDVSGDNIASNATRNAHFEVVVGENEYRTGNFTFRLVDNDDGSFIANKSVSLLLQSPIITGFKVTTDANGMASFRNADLYTSSWDDLMKKLEVGSYSVILTCDSPDVNVENFTCSLTVVPANVNISINPYEEYYGSDKKLNISVKNSLNEPMEGIPLKLTIDGMNKTYYFATDSNGISQIDMSGLVGGDYLFHVSNNDTRNIVNASANRTVRILQIPVEIDSVEGIVDYDSGIYLNVTANGKAVSDVYVFVVLYYDSSNITYIFLSSENGEIWFSPPLGKYEMVAVTADKRYQSDQIIRNITVVASNSSIEISDIEFDYCDSYRIPIIGKGAAGFTSKLNGTENHVSIKDGYIVFERLLPGTCLLSISTVPDENHTSVTKNVTVKVNKIDPDFNIEIASVNEGNPAVISIKTDSMFSGDVLVTLGGKNYNVAVQNGKGSKSISNLKPGTYEAIATFPETDMFKASVKSVKFNVIKKADEIKLTLKKVKVKKSAKKLVLSATLKVNGKAVKGKKLTFKFNGKTLKAKTNKKGVAKVTVKKKVLKKLKVGKKVKYQVSYQKTTRKLTAKVKK